MSNQETVDAIRLMVIGSLLAEYGCRLMVDDTKKEMKMRCNGVINAVKAFERYFVGHPNGNSQSAKDFKKGFNRNETVLLADLNLTLWEIEDEGLEEIVNAVKQAITPEP